MKAEGARARRTRARPRRSGGAGGEVRSASVRVREPLHLCLVQAATRALCRSCGLDEGAVFSAVIAVSELAHRLFIEGGRTGRVDLELVRRRRAARLEARARTWPGGACARVGLSFPGTSGTICS